MSGWRRLWLWLRIAVIALGVVYLAWRGWIHASAILHVQPLGIDFMPMWEAGRESLSHPARIYNVSGLTRLQRPLLEHFHGPRPFVYPPTALIAFAPFGLAPFALANAAWTLLGLVALLWSMAGQLGPPRALTLLALALTPASVLVLLTGQVTFFIAALAVVGVASLKDRPYLAGALLGIAGVIKPQAMVLAPIALLAIGAWRSIAAAAAAAVAAGALATFAFGAQVWLAWLAALPRFDHWVMAIAAFRRGMITPTALGVTLGLTHEALGAWRLAFALGGAIMAWFVFRRTSDPARRLAALVGGGLFVTPYAMHYDAALLAPAAALVLTHRAGFFSWIVALGAGALLCCAAIPYWGAAAVTAFVVVVALTPERLFERGRAAAYAPA